MVISNVLVNVWTNIFDQFKKCSFKVRLVPNFPIFLPSFHPRSNCSLCMLKGRLLSKVFLYWDDKQMILNS